MEFGISLGEEIKQPLVQLRAGVEVYSEGVLRFEFSKSKEQSHLFFDFTKKEGTC